VQNEKKRNILKKWKHPNCKAYNWLFYKIGDKFLNKYSPLMRGKLFDLGCGEGAYKSFFLEHAKEYVGVDWAGTVHKAQLDIAADLNKALPIENGAADCVVALSVLEHLYEPQVMLNEAYRILKPGGAMIIQVPWQWWIHEQPHDYFRFTPFGLKYMLEKAGFTSIEIEPQTGFCSMWILKFNYFSRRFTQRKGLLSKIIKMFLVPIWFIGQKMAPTLDLLDRNWMLESCGYYAVAKK